NGYSYVRSQSNCFMLDTKRPAKEVIDAMAAQKVFIGRIWPLWPTYTRITVGTQSEMEQFQLAFKKVMSGAVTASVAPGPRRQGPDEIPFLFSGVKLRASSKRTPDWRESLNGALTAEAGPSLQRRLSPHRLFSKPQSSRLHPS